MCVLEKLWKCLLTCSVDMCDTVAGGVVINYFWSGYCIFGVEKNYILECASDSAILLDIVRVINHLYVCMYVCMYPLA